MQTLLQREPPSAEAWANALEARPDAPSVDLGVHWHSGWREFGTSLAAFFTGPRPEKDSLLPARRPMRVEWIRAPIPGRSMLASVLWHVAIIWILILPIWGFLPTVTPTLAPVQIELTWYGQEKDLPPISLPAAAAKATRAPRKAEEKPKTEDAPAADAFHPRQTILSLPVHITHPLQTLIQPKAPADPPKIVVPLPNIVQWPAEAPAKPKIEYSTAASAPVMQKRAVTDVAAPEVANSEKNPGPINIASPAAVKLAPQLSISAMSARAAERKATRADAPAPEAPSPGEGDSSLPRIIALSAAPAPPAPNVSVPQGNLAARISVSPEGGKFGAAGGAQNGAVSGANAGANASAANASTGTGSSASSLPAAILISPGRAPLGSGGGGAGTGLGNSPGGSESATRHAPGMVARPALTQPAGSARVDASHPRVIDPNEPPDKILSGKEVYTLHVNLPNLTSASGSWVLNFAQLDEGDGPPFHSRSDLSGPAVLQTVDPKYPQTAIAEHVRGQVVLYAIIRKDGSVDNIQRVEGLDPALDRNAMEALAQWKFSPAKRLGVPVDLEAVIYIPFNYNTPLP